MTSEPEIEIGNSPFVKRKGKVPIVKFKLIKGKEEIEPWKGKDANVLEWMRNSSAILGDLREELATFWKIEKDAPVYFEDSMKADIKMDMAYFTAEKDGRSYDVASRLLDKRLKVGDRVKLTIMGCCSLIDCTRYEEEFL